jgi:hypothetical protein
MRFKAYTISTREEIEAGERIILYQSRNELYEVYGLNVKVNYIDIDLDIEVEGGLMTFDDISEN